MKYSLLELSAVWLIIGQAAYSHDEFGLPNWITKNHPSCCGVQDCKKIPASEVEVRQDGIYIIASKELLTFKDQRLKQSSDGEWWRCVRLDQPFPWETNLTRCLFIPGVS